MSVEMHCVVTQIKREWRLNGLVTIEKCSVQDFDSGFIIEDLPCAGMDLQPRDEITLTIQRYNANLAVRSEMPAAEGDAKHE